jgi:4'-phosphopantetheinyl transferase
VSSFPSLHDRAVHVCWVDATPVTSEMAAAGLAVLSAVEQERFHRYRRPLDAHQFLLGRLLIRRWLAAETGTPAAAWLFREGDRGRPAIEGAGAPWSFNLTHSGGLVACAIARIDQPAGSDAGIGVDLEDMERRPLTRDMARRFCAPEEAADIERQPDALQARRFLTYWTLKEAYLKARGLGIAVHLADVAFSLDDPHPVVSFRESLAGTSRDWAFQLFQPTPRYLLSVAAPQPAGTLRPAMHLHAMDLPNLVTP